MTRGRWAIGEMRRRFAGAVEKLGKKLPDVVVVAAGEVLASIILAVLVGHHLG
jgi:hypothetical protein